MINKINLQNFKCFDNNLIRLNKVTLLLGINSGGKSSFIQGLLLAKMGLESISKNNNKSLDLTSNEYNLNLYSFDEIIYDRANEDFITINLNHNSYEQLLRFHPTEDNNVVGIENIGDDLKEEIPIIYLNAERMITHYQKGGDVNNIRLGENNEYLGYILEKGQKRQIEVYTDRNHWDSKEIKFLDIQINNWLNFILPGSKVSAKSVGSDNYISLLFGDNLNRHQTNIGYGISFVLPIIVAGLISKKNYILIIENPELHLHPKAQSNIATFLSIVAASGVQVIIETHSEHIVNGFRKAVLDNRNPIKPSEVNINYFDFNGKSNVEEIKLNENADINYWPAGFMDQEENDLFEIRKMRFKK